MILYIFKSFISMGICFALYKLFLSKRSGFLFNRAFLLMGLIGSVLAPFISISHTSTSSKPLVLFVDQLITSPVEKIDRTIFYSMPPSTTTINIFNIVIAIYLFVCLALFIKFIFQLNRIISSTKRNYVCYQGGMNIILVKDERTPYSFFSNLFIDRSEFEKGVSEEVFLHEKHHALQLHTIDRLLINFIRIIQWWNPFIYMIENSIKENHEFSADSYVIGKMGNKDIYVEHLMTSTILSEEANLILSGYTHSSLLNRLKMLHSDKTSTSPIYQFLIALALLFTFYSCSDHSSIEEFYGTAELETVSVTGLYGMGEYIYPKILVEKFETYGFDINSIYSLEYKSPSPRLYEKFKNSNQYDLYLDSKKIENKELVNYNRSYIKSYRVIGNKENINQKAFRVNLLTRKGYFKMAEKSIVFMLEQQKKWEERLPKKN